MKPRKWVIVVFSCILVATFGLFEGVRYVEKNRNLEKLLTEQLSAASGGEVVVGRVKLGFFSVVLQDIRASLSLHTYTLTIRDIKVSFSLRKLLSTRGDFGKSISKIILLSPELDIRPFAEGSSSFDKPLESAKLLDAFRSLPVDFLLVRKGTVTVSAGAGESGVVVGEDLAGRLWNDPSGISVELRGSMASRRKNLTLSASFSRTGAQHRVSVRLDKAEISRPLRIGRARIVSGVLDGVAELSFPDSVTAATFESNGWVRIQGGSCAVDSLGAVISPISMYATLLNTTVRLDSMRFGMGGVSCFGKGDWDLANGPVRETGVVFRSQGIVPSQVAFLPREMAKAVTGAGWLECSLVKQKSTGNRSLSFLAGGITVSGWPVTLFSVKGRWEGNQIACDSVFVSGPGFSVKGSGIVNYDKPPVAYTGSFSCRLDSVAGLPSLHGQLAMSGSIRGLGADYVCDAMVSGRALSFNGIPLGSPEIRVSASRNKPVAFSTLASGDGFVSVAGFIDSLGTPHAALLTCNVALGTAAVRAVLAAMTPKNGLPRIDTGWARIAFRGTATAFSASGALGISLDAGVAVRGAMGVRIDKKDNEASARWQVYPQGLSLSGAPVPLRGQGTCSAESLTVDSLSILAGVNASGSIRFGASPGAPKRTDPDVCMNLAFRDASLAQACACAFGASSPVKSGFVNGVARVRGTLSHLRSDADLHFRNASVGFLTGIETDITCETRDSFFTILPTVVRRWGATLISTDTISNRNGLRFSGAFTDVNVYSFLKDALPEDFVKDEHRLSGSVSGRFVSTAAPDGDGVAAQVTLWSGGIAFDEWRLDSLSARMTCDGNGLTLQTLSACDSARVRVKAGGYAPWSALSDQPSDDDTLCVWASATGDLVASVEHNLSVPFHLPVSGRGLGTIDVEVRGAGGNYHLSKAAMQVPRGVLRVKPYVPEDIKDFSMRVTLDNPGATGGDEDDAESSQENAKLSVVMSGTIGRRPVSIRSTHDIPAGFEPIAFGFVDIGALLVSTPKHGIDVHIPGFTEIGAVSDVEFAPKAPWPEFALSGPFDKLCISGTWILRTCDITFPMLDNEETHVVFDPFPYITWNFDMKSGNRKVKYYYDTGKKRNLMRLVELYFDPVSVLAFRGRDLDNTFRLEKGLRFSTGSVFFGRTFDRDVDVGLDFVPQRLAGGQGYDNTPIIWGTADALSDSSRFDRIKLTLLTRDSITGAWMEKGRFYDIHFRVGTTIEDIPGQTEQRFVQQESDKYGNLSGAGTFMSSVGEQYIHKLLFQNVERRLAKTLGLDVITIETSIASNYFNSFYNRQFELSKWDYLALANVGITFGRYILNDKVFLKWRTDLVPVDTVLQPQYNVGFEFQPLQYFNMDVNYGIHMEGKALEANPQLDLELRLPIKDVRKLFAF